VPCLGIGPRAIAWKATMLPLHQQGFKSLLTGFEPARAKPNGLAVHLLNRSDTTTIYIFHIFHIFQMGVEPMTFCV
jgi:hypothetical protein